MRDRSIDRSRSPEAGVLRRRRRRRRRRRCRDSARETRSYDVEPSKKEAWSE